MSTPKRSRVSNRLQSLGRVRRLPKRFMAWVLRLIFVSARFTRVHQAGFVLPTTVLLLLVFSLTVGALSFRSFSRVEQTISQREQQVVSEFATPAIDRAKAKLEYVFKAATATAEKRLPSDTELLEELLRRAGENNATDNAIDDPYTLPDEIQLDVVDGSLFIDQNHSVPAASLNRDDKLDPAWSFTIGEGNDAQTIIYSISLKGTADQEQADGMRDDTFTFGADLDVASPVDDLKAEAMVVRNAPISTTNLGANCPIGSVSESGWQQAGSVQLEKNFQVNVLSIKYAGDGTPIVNAAEYQQVRVAPKGLKWGAWFRYDLDIFPKPNLRWNGAMHTEGNLFAERSFKAYLTSAPSSCISDPLASEISLNAVDNNDDGDLIDPEDFVGQVGGASIIKDTFTLRGGADNGDGDVVFHRYDFPAGSNIPNQVVFGDKNTATNTTNDSVKALANQDPSEIAIDPVVILTEDGYEHIGDGPFIDNAWNTGNPPLKEANNATTGRVELAQATDNRPFLDDGFRADNRYGPKPVYDSRQSLVLRDGVAIPQNRVGDAIVNHAALVADDIEAGEFGLDGYWERRSKLSGLRAIIGQRLELGNTFDWGGNNDPLYPPDENAGPTQNGAATPQTYKGEGETLQQRTLRDNLAAVQSLVVYHYTQGADGDLPYMCMASTAHPGTATSLVNSRTFGTYTGGNPKVDFLTGNGTNGWEFDFYANFGTLVQPDDDLGKALRNLAHFAGDPYGGAPSFPAVQGTEGVAYDGTNPDTAALVHPYPYFSMWGDFSVLRRILFDYNPATGAETDKLATEAAYNALSPADKSTLHTAACSLGMLAYSLKEQTVVPPAPPTLESNQILRDRAYGFRPQTFGIGAAEATTVKYPALYYLFPLIDHNQLGIDDVPGGAATGTPNVLTGEVDHTQPNGVGGEEYLTEDAVTNTYISGATGVNRNPAGAGAFLYSAVDPDAIDLTHKASIAAFEQPTATPAGATLTNADTRAARENRTKSYIQAPTGTVHELAFLDKVMMDGRELMAVRTMDLDLEKLTDNTVEMTGESWIPESDGLIYVFREDAVREDAIVRPKHLAATWDDGGANDCKVFNNLTGNANCYSAINVADGSGAGSYDPPLSTLQGISPKPVDMAPDPMRRPYGFRLINGQELKRSTSFESAGMTLVSDNPVYIKGSLNLHKAPGNPAAITDFLEEYQGASFLGTAFADAADEGGAGGAKELFYDRAAADLDGRFADPAQDTWRPTEIFADAVAILSDTFLDGEIEDTFVVEGKGPDPANYGNPNVDSSFLNFHRPCYYDVRNSGPCNNRDDNWIREDGASGAALTTPILVTRNGVLTIDDGGTVKNFPADFTNNDLYIWRGMTEYTNARYVDLMTADESQPNAVDANRVNALLISGVHPSRPGQTYGGLHNFPRMLEFWDDKPLFISGGMFQLNFSTQATGTFDQDAWEPGQAVDLNVQNNRYYWPPERYWGYDVALQYRFAAPIGQRFQSVGEPRNEYYRDLPLDDKYIKVLMCPREPAGVDTDGNSNPYFAVNKQLQKPDGSAVDDFDSCKEAVGKL